MPDTNTKPEIELPPLPDWTWDIGELSTSSVRAAIRAYARAAILADRSRLQVDQDAEHDRIWARAVLATCNQLAYHVTDTGAARMEKMRARAHDMAKEARAAVRAAMGGDAE